MKIAIPSYEGSVSPVFDVARRLLLVEVEDGREIARTQIQLDTPSPASKARRVAALGVDTLICGAISRPLKSLLSFAGVDVIAQTRGNVNQLLQAFIAGQLDADEFVMPGCLDRDRRRTPQRDQHPKPDQQRSIRVKERD